ncbi:hypothetical protein [uncultured Sphingomonas sp.]|uniref:hypothetical protein n=1 Tax=uncultured Sphingomonas sp. TaxID=158754 RepID=UPI0035CC7EF4
MPTDFNSLKKMDVPAAALAGFKDAIDRRGAIVRLHDGVAAPLYVDLSRTAGNIYTTRVNADQWSRLKSDPTVADVRLAQVERLIE